jgi:hypothetical protein
MPGLVGLLVTLGMVAVLPLGLRLLLGDRLTPLQRAWPVLGLAAGGALLLPRGATAVLAALPLAVACGVVTAHGLRAALPLRTTDHLVRATAAASPSVAAGSLVAERAGHRLLGFDLDVVGLTVAHFVFAGFAAVLLAGLTVVAAPGRAATTGALALPAGTALVAAGHFAGEALELVGALVVALGLLGTSWAMLTVVAPATSDRTARLLLRTAACATPFSMALALWWALGELADLPHPTLTQTTATHGVLNAVAVSLGGLLGYRLRAARSATPRQAAPVRLRG